MMIADPLPQIPAVLKAKPQWVGWRSQIIDGRSTKVPYRIQGYGKASSTDPATWCDYQTAISRRSKFDGLGFALAGEVCIDLDHCRNPKTGEIAPWAQKIVMECSSYTEISPSGTGLHIWIAADFPPGPNRKDYVEMYAHGRYLTVTGEHLASTPCSIEHRDLTDLRRRMEAGLLCPPKSNGAGHSAPVDDSKEDFKLCSALARQNGDPQWIDAEFRKSPLMRPKWDERRGSSTYGKQTVARAIASVRGDVTGDWRSRLILNPGASGQPGPPKAILENAITALRYAPEWAGVLGYNEFSLYTMNMKPTPWGKAPGNWSDCDDSLACCWLQRAGILVNSHIAAEAVQTVAHEHPFHPVRDYLQGLTWDGATRVDNWLICYLGCSNADPKFLRGAGSRWLISAVARIMRPGCKADYTLVLEGEQGIKKSTALQTLAGDEWFTDHISDLGSKDSRLDLHGKWIIEIAELSAMRRTEVERVKQFLTSTTDHFRMPYGRRTEDVPRSNVFAATTNDEHPFHDCTGNRRFWPLRCGVINVDALARDRDQIWAEAYARYGAGGVWYFETQELNDLARAEQDERYEPGVTDTVILEWAEIGIRREEIDKAGSSTFAVPVEPWDGSEPGKVTILDVLIHGLGKSLDRVTQADRNQVARCLIQAGWKQKQERSGPNRGKRFYVRPV